MEHVSSVPYQFSEPWTETAIGEYLAACTLDSKRIVLVGDPLRAFPPYTHVTAAIHGAYLAHRQIIEQRRRAYVKQQWASKKAAQRLNQYA